MRIERLSPAFGARISGLDLRSINDDGFQELREALYSSGFVVIKSQRLTENEYIEFGKKLGRIKVFVDEEYRHPEHPEIFVVSNVKRNGEKFGMDRVGLYWHTDCSFLAEPQPLTMLYCQIAPVAGGETEFFDIRGQFSRLSEELKARLRTLSCEHEGQSRYIISEKDVGLSVKELLERDRRLVPPVVHPMVFTHPFTRGEVLYVNEGFTNRIQELSEEESRSVLSELYSASGDQQLTYRHSWTPGEIVIWDNRSLLHKAHPPSSGSSRLMFRLGIADGPFFDSDNRGIQ